MTLYSSADGGTKLAPSFVCSDCGYRVPIGNRLHIPGVTRLKARVRCVCRSIREEVPA